MKMAFVTTYNAKDIKNWSGTAYYMPKALLDAGIEIEFFGDLKTLPDKFLIFRLRNLIYLARQVQERLNKTDVDIIFSPGLYPLLI